MKTLAGSARFLVTLALLALAAVVALLAPVQNGRRAGADHSELHIAPSAASSTQLANLFLLASGPPKTFYLRAKDVTPDPTGVAAFEVKVTYDNDVLSVISIAPDLAWLGSNGRSAGCSKSEIGPVDPDIPNGPWEAKLACSTLGDVPPWGAQGSGLLASITLLPGSAPGSTALTNLSFLINTTKDEEVIPVTLRSSVVTVAFCGDLNNSGAVDGFDIGIEVVAFGTVEGTPVWNPLTDLNGDGRVDGFDIGIIVVQFGLLCSN